MRRERVLSICEMCSYGYASGEDSTVALQFSVNCDYFGEKPASFAVIFRTLIPRDTLKIIFFRQMEASLSFQDVT